MINPICSDKCEACEAPRPLELDADSPGVVVAAAALTPLRQLRRKRERSPAVADAECPVGVVAAPPSTPLRRLRRKGDRAPAVVEVESASPTVVVDSSASPPRRCGRKRERAASPDVVELCDSAGRAGGGGENGEGKAPAAKKGTLAALCTVLRVR